MVYIIVVMGLVWLEFSVAAVKCLGLPIKTNFLCQQTHTDIYTKLIKEIL